MARARDYYFIALPLAVFYFVLALVVGVIKLMTLSGLLASPPLTVLFPHHGELMVFGFLATLVPAERYIGSRSMNIPPLIHAMPFLTSIGALLKLFSWFTRVEILNVAGTLSIAGGVLLYIHLLAFLSGHSTEKTSFRLMGTGALALLLSLVASYSIPPVGNLSLAFLMLAFPALTILGERVELSKFTMRRIGIEAQAAGLAGVLGFLVSIAIQTPFLLMAASLLFFALAVYIMRSERLVLAEGLKGYLSWHLIVAYAWFFLGFALAFVASLAKKPQIYFDPAVHALAVGFVLGMIYAHVPIVAPAILGRRVNETRLTLFPLALLTLGNILRLLGEATKVRAVVGYSGLLVLLSLAALARMMQAAVRD
jgi:nitrite reductase (NO-forming)